mmetsp:Transcript_7017/g.21004  ORF Transcript_7017/g.21004 Transcript_7017/m.21004 type:complete len:218 (-) Transcript_7017:254-907(-)|eukprot:CAMPEP_0113551700 /NCGR_PEP_ID=MMETSP0015_2-20120614/14666_1 /TAXON_ID=2838 /ORGANISM="Odontella" /LENGTH=217 /DNA_ID=CAMNT_0000452613 /DNA_START=99 /DNA_END=752 /DNA_ORIENTATION=+ /assembly_acc=CAM_ASM_000160
MKLLCALTIAGAASASAFVAPKPPLLATNPADAGIATSPRTTLAAAASSSDSEGSLVDSIAEAVRRSVRIARESSDEGADTKQIIANVLAGDYDAGEASNKIDEFIDSAPCVMFTWAQSPSCKDAVAAMELAGADFRVVRLDDPWDEGNPLRAELGKRVGKASVPSIWIGGEYVGGFDGGTGEESPGIADLAFRGVLHDKLKTAGALKEKAKEAESV